MPMLREGSNHPVVLSLFIQILEVEDMRLVVLVEARPIQVGWLIVSIRVLLASIGCFSSLETVVREKDAASKGV
jgi:hypothetical protein